MHVMAKMAKNHERAGDSNCMPKLAPWRVAILAKMAKFGKKSPEGWDIQNVADIQIGCQVAP